MVAGSKVGVAATSRELVDGRRGDEVAATELHPLPINVPSVCFFWSRRDGVGWMNEFEAAMQVVRRSN